MEERKEDVLDQRVARNPDSRLMPTCEAAKLAEQLRHFVHSVFSYLRLLRLLSDRRETVMIQRNS